MASKFPWLSNADTEVLELLHQWEKQDAEGNRKPIEILKLLATKVEEQYEDFLGLVPDPFDDRHPSQSYPECKFGDTLRLIVGEKEFMEKLTTSYLANTDDDFDLNCQAARLILDILSGLEGKIFEDWESIGKICYKWAKSGKEPLRTYAIDILAVGMQHEENAGIFREDNQVLVPIVLRRLKCLKEISDLSLPAVQNFSKMPPKSNSKSASKSIRLAASKALKKRDEDPVGAKTKLFDSLAKRATNDVANEKLTNENTENHKMEESKDDVKAKDNGPSTSTSDQGKIVKDVRGNKAKKYGYKRPNWCLWPLNVGAQQRLLLAYLTALGQYQELLPFAFELDALDLIFYYINSKVQKDPMLALRGLEYLSALMCHKKFVAEFVRRGGVQKFLEIPKQSTTSTGMSVCLFYLAYNDDAMERVCLLPHPLLTDLVKYALWLMDSGLHDSARCYATLFFSLVFPFRAIQDLFISMDGIRRLINTVTVLTVLRPEESRLMANDEAFSMRQTVKHTVIALRKFFEAQLSIKADEVRRKFARKKGTLPPAPTPAYKALQLNASQTIENVQLLLDNSATTASWQPVLAFKKLSGIPLLLQILSFAGSEWEGYSSRNDVARMVLDILFVLSVHPKAQLSFCQNVPVSTEESQSGVRILIRAAEGELIKGDGEIQKNALQVLCNCVCGPKSQIVSGIPRTDHGKPMKIEDILPKMWNAVRLQNGIKVLLGLISAKTPIIEADEIRCLACKALCGLSRSDRIQQVLHKLIFFYSGQLQMLMREPVLPDKTNEHLKFCRFASELTERVTGKALTEHTTSMPVLSRLKQADVVAQTIISYSEKELLQLIVNHLKSKGLHLSAKTLQGEASLKDNDNVFLTESPFTSPLSSKRRKMGFNHKSQELTLTPGDLTPGTPSMYRPEAEKPDKFLDTPRANSPNNLSSYFQPTLDNIVRNYLREQHAHCRNPVTTCPEFSLTRPHQCPEPRFRNRAPSDITRRIIQRQVRPRHGGPMGLKMNRKYIFSRFRPVGTIEDVDGLSSFTCAKFLPDGDLILLGTKSGDVKMYNIFTGQEEATYSCHRHPVSTCEPSKDLQLLLTSTNTGQPGGTLWSFFDSQFFEMKMNFHDDHYVKFNTAQDMVIGTDSYTAHVYDITTGKLTTTLSDPNNANRYIKNFATFNSTDDLILNDGCLWDVRYRRLVHKFDKFNDYVSGVFHPSGLEIVINSEIWDIRTFHLLDTCTALDQCRTIFNNRGDIIYAVKHIAIDPDMELTFGTKILGPFDSTFRTFDSYDYSVIATNDTKKTIFDICPDNIDSLVAVIEGTCVDGDIENVCRLYEVGRLKKIEGEESDEEVAGEEDQDDAIDDDDDDDDEFGDALDTLEDLLLDVEEGDGDDVDDDDDSDQDIDDDDFDYDDYDDIDFDTDDSNIDDDDDDEDSDF